ncbi:hypothetical protein Emag_000631 [Eimeria magna]
MGPLSDKQEKSVPFLQRQVFNGPASRRPLTAAELDQLCDLPKLCASSVDSADSKSNPGFFSGLLLRAEGNLRLATTSVTHALGPYTLPCLFLGGSLLGVATATAAFRARMRVSNVTRAASSAPPAPHPRASSNAGTLAAEAKHNRVLSENSKVPPAGWQAARAPSVLPTELRQIRRERHSDLDEEAVQSPPQFSSNPPRAGDLFTQKELATLFLLPASIILSVLAGGWLVLKYACDIRSVRRPTYAGLLDDASLLSLAAAEHFMQLIKWLTGRGTHPDAATAASSTAVVPRTQSPKPKGPAD